MHIHRLKIITIFLALTVTSVLSAQNIRLTKIGIIPEHGITLCNILEDEYTIILRAADASTLNEATFLKKDLAPIRAVNTTVSDTEDTLEVTEWARTGREIFWKKLTITKNSSGVPVAVHLCRRTTMGIYMTYEEKEWRNGELITDILEESTLDSTGNCRD